MSVFGVRKEFLDVNTPKTSISASAGGGKQCKNQIRHCIMQHLIRSYTFCLSSFCPKNNILFFCMFSYILCQS